MFFAVYTFGAAHYEGMRDPQVFFNLFRTYPFLLISAVGMTFVILTGGIDLSVSGVVALTTVAAAALLRAEWNAWIVIVFLLGMGAVFGALMGSFITFLKVQPFIATLAGMWLARGMCFFISDDAIAIDNRLFRLIGQIKILIPGLSDPEKKTGDFISILVIVAIVVLLIGIYLAHHTRFGRTVYAIGGNERSAQLMGLAVNRTKILVYTFNGICSALAGITLSIYVKSGHGLYAQSFELDVIASVVMGGTLLSGGAGYMFGTLFGVLVNVVIQTIILFNGQLSSWWTRITIGALTLMFIGVQSLIGSQKSRKNTEETKEQRVKHLWFMNKKLTWIFLATGAMVLLITIIAIYTNDKQTQIDTENKNAIAHNLCRDKPLRMKTDAANSLIDNEDIVLVFERNGGSDCIDMLYTIYKDGKILIDNTNEQSEKRATVAQVEYVITAINELGWFTDEMYSTWHTRCEECYGYYLAVSYNRKTKTVKGVDGGTDAPSKYWEIITLVDSLISNAKETINESD